MSSNALIMDAQYDNLLRANNPKEIKTTIQGMI